MHVWYPDSHLSTQVGIRLKVVTGYLLGRKYLMLENPGYVGMITCVAGT